MRAYDPKEGRYKDQSIGDTPKVYTIAVDGKPTKVVGVGCKNGGFYVLRADDGRIVDHTPIYTGPPTYPLSPEPDPRMLALPSCIGGLQTGCATDGETIFTNGIDALQLGLAGDDGRRAPCRRRAAAWWRLSLDTKAERWRHERPKVASLGGPPPKPRLHRRRRPGRLGDRRRQRRRLLHDRRQRQAGRPRRRHGRGPQGDRPRAGLVGPVGLPRPGLRRHGQHAVQPRRTTRPSSPRSTPASSTPSACRARTRSTDGHRKGVRTGIAAEEKASPQQTFAIFSR